MAYKYTGKGSWIPGVPARDLSDAEVKKFGELLISRCGLYEKSKSTTKEETETRGKKIWRE